MDQYKKYAEKSLKVHKNLLKSKSPLPEFQPFILEETIEDTFLNLPNNESIYDIFNAFSVSEDLPFFVLFDKKGRSFYKIYQNIIPPDEWINLIPPNYETSLSDRRLEEEENFIFNSPPSVDARESFRIRGLRSRSDASNRKL